MPNRQSEVGTLLVFPLLEFDGDLIRCVAQHGRLLNA